MNKKKEMLHSLTLLATQFETCSSRQRIEFKGNSLLGKKLVAIKLQSSVTF